jgi:hypothetical protein
MTISRIDKNRPVIYKNYVINVTKDKHRYIFKIRKNVDLELSGVTNTLDEAFEQARKMIDQMEDI